MSEAEQAVAKLAELDRRAHKALVMHRICSHEFRAHVNGVVFSAYTIRAGVVEYAVYSPSGPVIFEELAVAQTYLVGLLAQRANGRGGR